MVSHTLLLLFTCSVFNLLVAIRPDNGLYKKLNHVTVGLETVKDKTVYCYWVFLNAQRGEQHKDKLTVRYVFCISYRTVFCLFARM